MEELVIKKNIRLNKKGITFIILGIFLVGCTDTKALDSANEKVSSLSQEIQKKSSQYEESINKLKKSLEEKDAQHKTEVEQLKKEIESYKANVTTQPKDENVAANAPSTPSPLPATAATQRATYYKNCAAVKAAGAAPIYRGDPGYGKHLDRDGDGIGCEK